MALIGTLRNRMGTWVVVFVFVAISAFILGDLLGNNSSFFQQEDVGEIAGSTITLTEYQNAIKEQEMNYSLNTNQAPGQAQKTLIENQAWEMLIVRNAIEKQYEKLGLEVTQEEIWDMVQGTNVDQGLKSAPVFQNESGQFDRNKVVQFLQRIKNGGPEVAEERFRWSMYEQNLASSRKRIKYENLLIKTTYVTSAEAERGYHLENDVAEIKYLNIPYYAISDSVATVTDSDLQTYYNENKQKFESEFTRSITYVTFPVEPSQADSLDYYNKLNGLVDDLQTSANDSLFATGASDDPSSAYVKYTPSNLPQYLNPDNVVLGTVMGPFLDGNTYKIVKVTDIVPVARARHILIQPNGDTPADKKEAEERAKEILTELKSGADFAAKAREVSTDQSSGRNGGDLGWFPQSDMVKPFGDAVFNATKTGLLNDVVESQYGYHIIDVTNTKENKGYAVATVQYEILPSDASVNDALRRAENFQAGVGNLDDLKTRAQEEGLSLQESGSIRTSERRIGMLGEAREIVRWAFGEASVGDVSKVFDLNDQFVVAVVTGEQKKGIKPLDAVKDEITPLVRNKVKGRIIIERLGDVKNKSFEELAQAFGNDAVVNSVSDLKLNTNSIQSVGFDPRAVGLAFSLEKGERSEPFAGENGVVIIEMQNKTVAPAVADYSQNKSQLEQTARSRSYSIAEAIKEDADIEDERYKHY